MGNFAYGTVLGLLADTHVIEKFDYTHLILIPMGRTQATSVDFRPIDLCNALYKIMSKTISNKITKVLPHLVSHNQCAFINGRNATNNALISLEILHHIHRSHLTSIDFKLDLSKEFDKVEWNLI